MEQSNFLKNNWKYTFYNSQTLTTKDIKESLLGKTWLNDNIITFFYLYLENEKFKDKNYSFVCPSTVFMIHMLEGNQF